MRRVVSEFSTEVQSGMSKAIVSQLGMVMFDE
jgi:hypothetical protein